MSCAEPESPPFPYWVNKQFIESVLNNGNEGTALTVKIFESDSASKRGMSFSSDVIRIVAAVRPGESDAYEKRSFVLKYMEIDWEREDVPKDFQTETMALDEVIPEVHKLLRSVEGEAFQPVAPLCHVAGSTPFPFLAIEDLSPAGFTTADAALPLDYEQCAAVVRAYARLHAASARVLKDRPHYKTVFDPKDTMNEGLQEYYKQFSDHLFKAAARQLRAHSGFESYAQKYERLAEKFTNDFFNYWRSTEVRLPVILHGDCWKYNYMFANVGGNNIDVRLIDFQGSKVHSEAADLLHFLYRNASVEVHRDHLDTLLADYHGTLVALLRQLDMAAEADSYPLQALVDDVQAGGACGVYYSALSLMSLTSHSHTSEWGKFFQIADGSASLMEDVFRNPHYVSCLKYLAPVFDRKGLL
ncbi:uncharacterized protein LOC126457408 [Schistocerca serialis cubense]|uniref:uncharacterized protein LOC126457408 n=1 Tax=Schistocerca serialis cubense TaxID=2023355 RepID=UPI00214F2D2D|nr:uncharacterized protein LOC126457408 [Schistocerca serialis cubense]